MTTKPPQTALSDAIQVLTRIFPAHGLLHVGAGLHSQADAELYRTISPQKAVMLDADPDSVQHLKSLFESDDKVWITQAVLGAVESTETFHHASLSQESGLLPTACLAAFWKNISLLETSEVETKTISGWMLEYSEGKSSQSNINWLYVDCFPATEVLQGGAEFVSNGVDVVLARVVLSESDDKELEDALGPSSLGRVQEWMSQQGFILVSHHQHRHPRIGLALFARDWKSEIGSRQVADQELILTKSALNKLRKDHRKLKKERDACIAGMTQSSEKIRAVVKEIEGAKKRKRPAATRRTETSQSKAADQGENNDENG